MKTPELRDCLDEAIDEVGENLVMSLFCAVGAFVIMVEEIKYLTDRLRTGLSAWWKRRLR